MVKQKLFNMKYRELYKKLETAGWKLERTNKHRIYVHPEKEKPLTVPNHPPDEVPTGMLNKLLKQAGLK